MVYVSLLSAALLMPAMVRAQAQGEGNQNNSGGERGGDRGNRGGDRGGDRGGQGGDRGRWDPAQMRQRMEGWMKEQLKVNDDEWKVIQPKLEKVFNLQRDTRGGGMMFRRPEGQDESTQSPVQKASRDLRQALDNNSASADELASKLKVLREAKEKAKTELTNAQKELKEVLTQRQEATLVMLGMLD
jgi:hypothetical protein